MVDRSPDFFPERSNLRVEDMAYVADVSVNGRLMRVELGAPATLSATAISTFTLATAAQTNTTGLPVRAGGTAAAKWGRCLQAVANGTGANAVVTVNGRDYLGQRMSETFTLASTTAKTGVKAFMFVDSIVAGSNANATDVCSVGTTDKFGLPYAAVLLVASMMNGDTAGAHTFVTRSTTTPQTATSTDPRGTLALSTASNGTRTFAALMHLDTAELHGYAHYAA